MDPTGQKGDKLDAFDMIWARVGKERKAIIDGLVPSLRQTTKTETIWEMVELAGIKHSSDKLRTFQALKAIRDEMRRLGIIRIENT